MSVSVYLAKSSSAMSMCLPGKIFISHVCVCLPGEVFISHVCVCLPGEVFISHVYVLTWQNLLKLCG